MRTMRIKKGWSIPLHFRAPVLALGNIRVMIIDEGHHYRDAPGSRAVPPAHPTGRFNWQCSLLGHDTALRESPSQRYR